MGRRLKSAASAGDEAAKREEALLRYGLAVAKGREDLLAFAHIMMPDAGEPHNPDLSRYAPGREGPLWLS